MLTKQRLSDLKDLTRNLVSISTDHSTLDQECQCRELLNAMVPIMFGSEDGERMLLDNNGSSMKSQRLSRITNGSLTHLTSKEMEHQLTLDAPLPTQDGGNSLDTKIHLSPMKKERSLRSKEILMLNKEISLWVTKQLPSINNGTLSMLMNGRENQERENSMKNSVSTLKDHSISFLLWANIDTLT